MASAPVQAAERASTRRWSALRDLGDRLGGESQRLHAQRARRAGASRLNFKGAPRFGSAHWKLSPLDEYSKGRPVAWIDDSFDESCYQWADSRANPTLSSRPSPPSASRRPTPKRSWPGRGASESESHQEGTRLTRGQVPTDLLPPRSPQDPGPRCPLADLVGEPAAGGRGSRRRLRDGPSAGIPAGPGREARRPDYGGGVTRRGIRARPAELAPTGGTGSAGWVRIPRAP